MKCKLLIEPKIGLKAEDIADNWNSDEELNEFAVAEVENEKVQDYFMDGVPHIALEILAFIGGGIIAEAAKDLAKDKVM